MKLNEKVAKVKRVLENEIQNCRDTRDITTKNILTELLQVGSHASFERMFDAFQSNWDMN